MYVDDETAGESQEESGGIGWRGWRRGSGQREMATNKKVNLAFCHNCQIKVLFAYKLQKNKA